MNKYVDWQELTVEQRKAIMTRLEAYVKIKFDSGEIITFQPFRQTASMPPHFIVDMVTEPSTLFKQYIGEDDSLNYICMCVDILKQLIKDHGIETSNIQYLKEAKLEADHLRLNLNLDY